MRLLGLDFETTGLDVNQARITEMGLVIWDSMTHRPLVTVGVFLYSPEMDPLFTPDTVAMMERVSGITPAMLKEFGTDPKRNLEWLDGYVKTHRIEAIVAHNGKEYDRPLLMAELARHGVPGETLKTVPWLDTKIDIPWATPPESNKLKHLALEQGFINPFPHRAVFDVLTMLKVLSQHKLEDVITHSKKATIIIRAVVPHPKQDNGKGKDAAKAAGYRWQEVNHKQFPLCWVKAIKEDQLEAEKARLPDYQVVVVSQ